jgi:GMP synthase-like glutamine amidotransferase
MGVSSEWVAIQHVAYESPGSMLDAASRAGLALRSCHPYRGEPLPRAEGLAGLVVMGGPMGVADTAEHPHLAGEIELISAMIAAQRPVLGVCLGAQLLASALGARVHRGEREEIGAGEVTLTAAGTADPVLGAALRHGKRALPAFHWHRETFELPSGAVLLASSAHCVNQAFRYGELAYGLQFHIELDRQLAEAWRPHLPDLVTIDEQARQEIECCGLLALTRLFELALA